MSGEAVSAENPRRKALKLAASGLCIEAGFTNADDSCLETLVEMLQSYITELGQSSKGFAELACRTEPMITDVFVALVEMGANVADIQRYAKAPNKVLFLPPSNSLPSMIPRTLQAGERKSHPPHIPDHLPAFPDPHTYIKTPTVVEPGNEYQLIRERAASQKRDVERALTRFIAKTGHTENLFPDDPYAYPLIACKPKQLPYLEALLPKHLDLEALDDLDDSAKPPEVPPGLATAAVPGGSNIPVPPQPPAPQISAEPVGGQEGQAEPAEGENSIDNPYLRPIKMPKFRTKKGKY